MNGFRTLQHADVMKQYKLAADGLLKKQKFLEYFGAIKWTQNMDTGRTIILWSAIFDKEITENIGICHNIYEPLREQFLRLDQTLVQKCDA